MSKKPRVPLTYGQRQQRIVAVAQEHLSEPGVYYQPVQHDDDCPSLKTQSLKDCVCDPIVPAPTRLDP